MSVCGCSAVSVFAGQERVGGKGDGGVTHKFSHDLIDFLPSSENWCNFIFNFCQGAKSCECGWRKCGPRACACAIRPTIFGKAEHLRASIHALIKYLAMPTRMYVSKNTMLVIAIYKSRYFCVNLKK